MSSFTALGSNSNASANSIVVTTSIAAAIGDLVVFAGAGQFLAPTFGFSDSAGNSWTSAIANAHGSIGVASTVYYSVLTATMAIGATGTLTTGGGLGQKIGGSLLKCTNPAGSPLDSTPTKGAASASAGSAASTGTTAAPSTSDWVGVTASVGSFPAVTFTPQASWTEMLDAQGVETQAIIGTSTTAMRGAATLSSAGGDWSICVAVFKLSSAAAANHNSLALLGVG